MSRPRLVMSFHDDKSKGAKNDTFEQKLNKSTVAYQKRTGLVARSCFVHPGVFARLCPAGEQPESIEINGVVVEGRSWVMPADMHVGDEL